MRPVNLLLQCKFIALSTFVKCIKSKFKDTNQEDKKLHIKLKVEKRNGTTENNKGESRSS